MFALSTIAVGQTIQSDTEDYKSYSACSECFEEWNSLNGNSVGSPARTNRTDGTSRTQYPSDNPVKQEGKRFLGQTLAIISSAVLAGFLILISSK